MPIRKVVSMNDVESHTRTGWKVVDSFKFEEMVQTGYHQPVTGTAPGGYSYTQPEPKFVKVKSRRFVLELTDEAEQSELVRLIQDIAQLEQDIAKNNELYKSLNNSFETTTCEYLSLKHENDLVEKERISLLKEVDEQRSRILKYEKDIAKIRNEIGEARMREILGEKK